MGAGVVRREGSAPTAAGQTATPAPWLKRFGPGVSGALMWFLPYFALALSLQWRAGAYQSGFGTYPDEPSHFVTGLMVYKYLTGWFGSSPMAFAERFYAHYPAVGFGHWPPLFYTIQALWGVPFGLSRTSALVLMAVMAAVSAALVSYSVRMRYGRVYGAVFGVLFVVLPIVQLHTAAIMAELPLTVFSFATVLAFVKLVEKPTKWQAWVCGLCLAAAILVKGDGWALLAIPVCAPFLTEHPYRFARKWGWITLAPVAVICVPYMLLTINLATDGFERLSPSWTFIEWALYRYAGDHVRIVGYPLMILALIGAIVTVLRPLLARRAGDAVWILNSIMIAAVFFFHALVPTSLEPRKIFMSIPSLLLFSAAGVKYLSDLVGAVWRIPKYAYPVSVGVLVSVLSLQQPASLIHRNMGPAAQAVLDSPTLDRSAVLVGSTAFNESEELSFVAELAAREKADFHHAIIRAGKFLADSSWMGTDYKLRYTDPKEVHALLDAIPVSCAVLYVGKARPDSHARLIKDVLMENAGEWNLIHSQPSAPGKIEVFALRTPSQGPVRLPQIDLHRKLGRSISAEF